MCVYRLHGIQNALESHAPAVRHLPGKCSSFHLTHGQEVKLDCLSRMFNGFLQNTFVVYVFVAFVVVVVVVFALRAPNATLWYPIASTCHCFGFSLYFSIVTHLFDFRLFIILHVYRVYCVDATNYQLAPPPTPLLVPHAHTLTANFILRCIPPT